MRLIFGLFGVCFLPSCAESSKLHARGLARLLHPFADDEEQAKNAEREGRTAAGARGPPYDIPDMDPEDSVVAHSLFDPHIEPQDADGELEDPSMLPSSGVGYELEKRDQLREDEAATGAAAGSKQHKRKGKKGKGARLNTGKKRQQSSQLQHQQQQQRLETPRLVQQDEDAFAAEDEESQAEADSEAAEDEELQREEQIDEKEEMQHDMEQKLQEAAGKAQPPPPKLPPDEARKLLLSYGAGLEDIINQIISAHAGVPDLLGTKARKAQAEGKSPMKPPLYSRPRSTSQPTVSGSAAAGPAAFSPAGVPPGPPASLPSGGPTAFPASATGGEAPS